MATRPERDDDFRRFVEAHWMGLVRSAYLVVGDRGAAEDLVQQTLATVYRHWDRGVRDGAPLAYVRKSMVNHAISTSRRRRVKETLLGTPAGFDGAAPQELVETDPRDAYKGVDDRDLVVRALRDLPPRMRAVVVLR